MHVNLIYVPQLGIVQFQNRILDNHVINLADLRIYVPIMYSIL